MFLINLLRVPILILVVMLASVGGYAQVVTIKGKVIDENKESIPFCAIEDTTMYTGVLCDDSGRFTITVDGDQARPLIFYAMGYGKKVIPIKELAAHGNDSVTISMKMSGNYLKGVTVTGRRAKMKERVLGKKHQRHKGGCYMQYGDEVAIYLATTPEKRAGYLKEIFIYITDEGAPSSKFRVNIYKKKTGVLSPGMNLAGDIIVHATEGNEWVRVDVSDRRIPTEGGLFIGVEWMAKGNSPKEYAYDPTRNWYIAHPTTLDKADHKGQVLGTTWGYGRTDRTFYKYKGTDKWEYWGAVPPKRTLRIAPVRHWFNAMIYSTYTYNKRA